MTNTSYNHNLLGMLRAATNILNGPGRDGLLSSALFNEGGTTPYGTIRMWVDHAGVVHLHAVDRRVGDITMSTADSDAAIVERWLGIPGCPDGVLGHGD